MSTSFVNPTSTDGINNTDRIQRSFERFHFDNPHVYTALVAFAREAKAAGFGRYGMKSLFERLRWHYEIELRSTDLYKLNNNYTSRYARLIMATESDLKHFFETRSSAATAGA
jgi:hypothetical protein